MRPSACQHSLGVFRAALDVRNRQCRSIGADNGLSRDHGFHVLQHASFGVQVFDDGLDDQAARREKGVLRADLQSLQSFLWRIGGVLPRGATLGDGGARAVWRRVALRLQARARKPDVRRRVGRWSQSHPSCPARPRRRELSRFQVVNPAAVPLLIFFVGFWVIKLPDSTLRLQLASPSKCAAFLKQIFSIVAAGKSSDFKNSISSPP